MKRTKNRYPTNIKRNDYINNPKRSTIETPIWLAEYIYRLVDLKFRKIGIRKVIDIGCWKGNLSKPFTSNYSCTGIDIKKVKYHSSFIKLDFLNDELIIKRSIREGIQRAIICNPPFNDEQREYGRALLPELFLRKIFEEFGSKVPLIFFAPMGVLFNQRLDSSRWKWIRDCGAKITSELILPIDVYIPEGNLKKYDKAANKIIEAGGFPSYIKNRINELKRKYKIILVHSSVLFFNIPGLPAKMFLEDK